MFKCKSDDKYKFRKTQINRLHKKLVYNRQTKQIFNVKV